MAGDGEDNEVNNTLNPPMDMDTPTILRALMESVATLTRDMSTLKGQLAPNTPPIPLGTNLEPGQTSHQQQAPLPSQQQAYEEA